jgi:23S rRNA pseudouridine1911/1915/1917 synthase
LKRTDHLTEDRYLVTHHVDPAESGLRLDAFLKERYSKRSRAAIQRAIESGAVTLRREQGPHVSAGRLKPALQLLAGDEIQVLSERRVEPEVRFDYRVLHEDPGFLVVDKPAPLPVHPAGRYFFNTLLVHLRTRGHQDPLKAEREYFLAHRIDKETSGLLVLARSRETCAELVRQFAERRTEKFYLAIVHGLPPESFRVELPLKRDERSAIRVRMRTATPSEGGLPSSTEFQRLCVNGPYSLLECHPLTGRQHQIRVHLEAAGHPIVGDKLYGMPEEEALRYFDRQHLTEEARARLILPRHALHAHRLAFDHPVTGQRLEFVSELPPELREFMDRDREREPH